jgi:FkbM family methyltransferase
MQTSTDSVFGRALENGAATPDGWAGDLILPPFERYAVTSSFNYGAETVAARYCGLNQVPDNFVGNWFHGWWPKHSQIVPEMLLCDLPIDKRACYWVARKDEETYLHRHGYKKALAIGLPLVYYSPRRPVPRRPGTLLVMPIHSLEFTTSNGDFERYADEIAAVRDDFSRVVVCVHPACWERGYWIDAFQRRGFEVVRGISYCDRNGLARVHALLSSFEHMTTNGFGSHIVYAAALGAKASIFGTFTQLTLADCSNHPLAKWMPSLIGPLLETGSEKTLRRVFPALFCGHPCDAREQVEWGRHEIGCDNKVPPAEMRKLFGWHLRDRVAHYVGTSLKEAVKAATPEPVKRWRRLLIKKEYRERERLKTLEPDSPALVTLFGKRLHITSPRACLSALDTIFKQEAYRFAAANSAPFIIDGRADVGLGVLYFKRTYPDSRVLAFEPDPDAFKALRANCDALGLTGVELAPKKLWTCETVLQQRDKLAGVRQVVADRKDGMVEVRTARLRDLLRQPVDLLKLDLAADEATLLEDCQDLLTNVAHLVLHYRSAPEKAQGLAKLLALLEGSGFRHHVHNPSPSPRPLFLRAITQGCDLLLTLFAFRH